MDDLSPDETAWEAVELAIEAAIKNNSVGLLHTDASTNRWFGPSAVDPACFETLIAAGLRQTLVEFLQCALLAHLRETTAPAFRAAVEAAQWAASSGGSCGLGGLEAVAAAVEAAAASLNGALAVLDDLAAAVARAQVAASSSSLPTRTPEEVEMPVEVLAVALSLRCALAAEVFAGPPPLALLGSDAEANIAAAAQTPLGALAALLGAALAQAEQKSKRRQQGRSSSAAAMSDAEEEEKGNDEEVLSEGEGEGSASSESDQDDDGDEEGGGGLSGAAAARCWASLQALGWLGRPDVARVVASLACAAVRREVGARRGRTKGQRLGEVGGLLQL